MTYHIVINGGTAIAKIDYADGGETLTIAQGASVLSEATCNSLMTSHDLADIAGLIDYLGLEDQING